MSTELDDFFAALRRDADDVPAAPPDVPRRLGRRRQRRVAIVAVVAVFAVVGTVAVAIGRPTVTRTAAQKPTTFQRLAPVGAGIGLGQPESPGYTTVVTMGDRAFVCLQSESGQTSVVAVDLATGRAIWGPTHLADFNDTAAVYWHPQYVVIMGRHDNGSRPDGTIFALDPATGKTLMHLDVDNFEADDVVLGESTLVIGARRDGKTRGYDLATGRVRWTVPDPASRIVDSLAMQSAAGAPPESQRGGFGGPPIATSQFVQLTADGTAIVRNLANGTESARRAGAASVTTGDSHNQALAVDGILYVVDHDKPGTIRAVDMSGPAAATDVYTTANGMQVARPLWCGPTQICFEEQGSPGDEHVTGFDTAARKVRWRQDGSILRLQVVNGQVLLNLMTRSGDPRSAVMDASGRQILSEQAQTGTAGWIDGNALLIIGGRDRDAPASVSGVSPLTGGPVQLGVVDGNRGCGWSRTHLVCVTITGIKVWRFAA